MPNAPLRTLPPALLIALVLPLAASLEAGATDPPGVAAAKADDAADAAVVVRAALARIGGDAWSRIKSFESISTARSAVGDARIEYRFVAPDARKLVQTMPGGRGVLEMGVVGGKAWMGEPGRARAIDPQIAEEMAGGGDLQTLVHSLDTRFGGFAITGKAVVNGRDAWRIEMTPRAAAPAGTAPAKWVAWIDTMNSTILGLDIPAPSAADRPDAPTPAGQSIRFSEWRVVEVPKAKDDEKRTQLLCFGKAEIESEGMKVVLEYERVAVDTLEPGSIIAPAAVEPMQP